MKLKLLFTVSLGLLFNNLTYSQISIFESPKQKPNYVRQNVTLNNSRGGGCVPAPYSAGDPFYDQVIQDDPFCCDTEWDGVCQSQYNILAGIITPGETCDSAITAVEGVNQSDGPEFGLGCLACGEAINADWFVFEAPSAGTISISSCNEGSDTRVWVYEADSKDCSALTLIAQNDDYCITEPGGDEFASFVQFPVCDGKFYFLEWDDAWSQAAFNFNLDFTSVAGADAQLNDSIFTEYTKMPRSAGAINATVGYRNVGALTLNNIQAELTVTKNGSPFFTNTQAVLPSLVVCTDDDFSISTLTQETGTYSAQVRVFANESEVLLSNNTKTQTFTVDTVYARDNGNAIAPVSLGTDGIIGHTFFLPKPDVLTSVSVKLVDAIQPGSNLQVDVYSTDANGMPTTFLGSSIIKPLVDADTTGWLTLRIGDGPLSLPAGRFFIGSVEAGTSVNIPIGVSDGIYTPQVAFANIPGTTNGFETIETLGASGISLMLRANFGQTFSWASVKENAENIDFKLMPNPSSGIFNITYNGEATNARISVLDATGKLIVDEKINNSNTINHTIDLSNFANGIYTLRLIAGKEVINRKLVLSK